MTTTVVNLLRSRKRPDVYIGRAGHGSRGEFGNPVVPGAACPVCHAVHLTKGLTLPCYERYLVDRVAHDPAFRAAVLALHGKVLGCFCSPPPGWREGDPLYCHGQVLARWLAQTLQSTGT